MSGCSDEKTSSTQPLSSAGFKDKAAAAIVTGSDLEAEPGFGPKVNVSARNSLNTFSIRLGKSFAAYRREPARLDAMLGQIVEQAKARMVRGNSRESFGDVRTLLLPILKPKVAFRDLAAEPAATSFPGNLRVAYAVQRPESFTLVTIADVVRWKRPLGEIHRLALANLLGRTNSEEGLLCEPSGGEKLCGWGSGDGYDATRMLVPELRRQIARELGGPAVYAVPLESVFVALARKHANAIRTKVLQQFTTGTNPVSPDLFVERGGELVVLAQ
jgi:uncharacterized protein YtpQ (UPF0354 family)